MVGVHRGGFEVLAVAADVVFEQHVDTEGPVHRPIDVLGNAEADPHRQRAAEVIGLSVLQAALFLRMLVAVGAAVPQHVFFDIAPPRHAGADRGPVHRGAVVKLVVLIHVMDQHPGRLIVGAVEAAALLPGRIIPLAPVGLGIDGCQRVQNYCRLGGVFLVSGQGIRIDQVVERAERQGFHHPRVVCAGEVVDALVRPYKSGARIGMAGVRQDVAVGAPYVAGVGEGRIAEGPRQPARPADGASGKSIGERRAGRGHGRPQPLVIPVQPCVRLAADRAGDLFRPVVSGDVGPGARHVLRRQEDNGVPAGNSGFLKSGGSGRKQGGER